MALFARDTPANNSPTPTAKCADAQHIIEWLTAIVAGPLVEMRAIGVTRAGTDARHVESVLYKTDEAGLKQLAKDARSISPRAEGVYFTLNELSASLEGQRRPAKDSDVTRRRRLLIDVDPIRPAGQSSTDNEKYFSHQVIIRIRDDLTAKGWPLPILADSGNGWHLLYPIDLPPDDGGLVARVLKTLAARYDTDLAKVDTTVGNPSRICKLYGTLARKGESTPDRPYRCSAVFEHFWKPTAVPREMLEDLAGDGRPVILSINRSAEAPKAISMPVPVHAPVHEPAEPKLKRKGIFARDLGDDPIEAFTTKAIEDELQTLGSTPAGGRNVQLFKSAASLFELVNAGTADRGEVERRLENTAWAIGLEKAEIQTTLKSAWSKLNGKARDLTHVGKSERNGTTEDRGDGIREHIDDPHRLAREFLKRHYAHRDGPTLRFWNEEWHAWKDGSWLPRSDREINSELTRFCKYQFDVEAEAKQKPPKTVGTRLIANVALALRSFVLVPLRDVPEQPAWLDIQGPRPDECLNCRNGIIHLPTLAPNGDERSLTPSTPRFFTPNVLDYAFDFGAGPPMAWIEFMRSVWGTDTASIECLQDFLGYLLTPDTRQQKMLMLIGPKRSGKGTIARVIKALIGEANVSAPTLSSLGGRFGSQPLIGKTVAICAESRMTGRADSQAIVERLLSISGEDPQSIERKGIGNWSGTLRTRFVLQGNELPRLGDYSGALPSRLILLKMDRSFLGQEDRTLTDRLLAELPSILLWSVIGWKRLKARGHFLQPKAAEDLFHEFEELNNPVGAFLAEKCEMNPIGFQVPLAALYQAWCSWCKDSGRDHPGDVQGFGRNLRTALPKLEMRRVGTNGKGGRVVIGIRLSDDFATD
jgi:putative DNA primase/helicase